MTSVRGPHHGNVPRMPRRVEPVVDGRADRAAADRRLARAVMAGDEENDPVAARDRLIERPVDRPPGGVEAHAVQVDDAIGLDTAGAEPPVPRRVEGRTGAILPGSGRWKRGTLTEGGLSPALRPLHQLRWFPSPFRGRFLTR
jgi:hypothetical protein